jgi:peptidase C25-like protein/flagellar hook capping protein FlgD
MRRKLIVLCDIVVAACCFGATPGMAANQTVTSPDFFVYEPCFYDLGYVFGVGTEPTSPIKILSNDHYIREESYQIAPSYSQAMTVPQLAGRLAQGYGWWLIASHGVQAYPGEPNRIYMVVESYPYDNEAPTRRRADSLNTAYGNDGDGYPSMKTVLVNQSIPSWGIAVSKAWLSRFYFNETSVVCLGVSYGADLRGGFSGAHTVLAYTYSPVNFEIKADFEALFGNMANGPASSQRLDTNPTRVLQDAYDAIQSRHFTIYRSGRSNMVLAPIVESTTPSDGERNAISASRKEIIVSFDCVMDHRDPTENVRDIVFVYPLTDWEIVWDYTYWDANDGSVLRVTVDICNANKSAKMIIKAFNVDVNGAVQPGASANSIGLDGNTSPVGSGYAPNGDEHELSFNIRPDAFVERFVAVSNGATVDVGWRTSYEGGTQSFVVERADRWIGPYERIASVAGGNRSYSVRDANRGGIYRLLEVDSHGDTLAQAADSVTVAIPADTVGTTGINAAMVREAQGEAYIDGIPTPVVDPSQAEWICIAPDSWVAAAQPLASFWTGRGTPACVVDLSTVGGFGGIKSYLAPLWNGGNGTLRYVLLAGDANDYGMWLDNTLWSQPGWPRLDQQYPTQQEKNIIPLSYYVPEYGPPDASMAAFTPYWGSDWGYVDFNGDGRPDIALGRAPVITADQLTAFVQKTINAANMPTTGAPVNHVGLWKYARTSGYKSGRFVMSMAARLAGELPTRLVVDELEDSDAAPMSSTNKQAAAIAAINTGRALIIPLCTGSGRYTWGGWLDEYAGFRWWQTASLDTFPRVYPFVMGLSCGLGDIDQTEDPFVCTQLPPPFNGCLRTAPLMQLAMTETTRGPWGGFGPTRGSWEYANYLVGREFLRRAYDGTGASAGECARLAVGAVLDEDTTYSAAARSYIFIGDPRVELPSGNVTAPTAAMSGPSSMTHLQHGTWTALPGGADGIYSYEWRRRNNASEPWSDVLWTQKTYSTSFTDDFQVMVTVRSMGLSVSATKCVSTDGEAVRPTVTSIVGPARVCVGESGTWTATATGGCVCGDYRYEWRYRPAGSGSWSGVDGTSRSYTKAMGTPGLDTLRVDVYGFDDAPGTRKTAVTGVACAVADLNAEIIGDKEVVLGWHAPGVASSTPTGAVYDLRRALSPITSATFTSGVRADTTKTPFPDSVGRYQSYTFKQLSTCTLYYFAIKRRDAGGHWSPISNGIWCKTLNQGGGTCSGGGGGGGGSFEIPASARRVVSTAKGGNVAGGDVQGGRLAGGSRLLPQTVMPGTGAFTAEMDTSGESIVWSLYPLASEQVDTLAGMDSARIIRQMPREDGGWETVARITPSEASWRFALRSLRSHGRVVFLGGYSLYEALEAVDPDGPGPAPAFSVTNAHHSRLGDVTADLSPSGDYEFELIPGDTLRLTYEPDTSATDSSRTWFLLVSQVAALADPAALRGQGPGEEKSIPTSFALKQNRPNPFSELTSIHFDLPVATHVKIEIFDAQGRLLRTVVNGELPAGFHAVDWDHRDESAHQLGAGVYLYRIQAGAFRDQKKMVLLAP